MPPRTKLDYETLADGVIRKVLDANLELFKAADEDEPTLDEVMSYSA